MTLNMNHSSWVIWNAGEFVVKFEARFEAWYDLDIWIRETLLIIFKSCQDSMIKNDSQSPCLGLIGSWVLLRCPKISLTISFPHLSVSSKSQHCNRRATLYWYNKVWCLRYSHSVIHKALLKHIFEFSLYSFCAYQYSHLINLNSMAKFLSWSGSVFCVSKTVYKAFNELE